MTCRVGQEVEQGQRVSARQRMGRPVSMLGPSSRFLLQHVLAARLDLPQHVPICYTARAYWTCCTSCALPCMHVE